MTLLSDFFKDSFEAFRELSIRQWLAVIVSLPFMILVGLFPLVRLVFYPYLILINWIANGTFLSFAEYWNNHYW